MVAASVAAIALVVTIAPASAKEFNFGPVEFSFSNTISAAASFRTSAQHCDHISAFNGGCHASNGAGYGVNSDDGNVNVERGELGRKLIKWIPFS